MLRACVTTPTAAAAASSFRRCVTSQQQQQQRFSRRRGGAAYHRVVVNNMASSAGTDGEKVYPEEQKVEVGGKLYRRCAAALVFNTKGEVLVGERSDRPGSWNMPQGGVEMNETTVEAASRELYEEVGMKAGETRAVYSRTISLNLRFDRGLEGEKAEFSQVKWMLFDDIIEAVWESKRGPYIKCKELASPLIEKRLQ